MPERRQPGSTAEIPSLPQQVLIFNSEEIREVERRENERGNRRARSTLFYLPSTILSPQRRSSRIVLNFPSLIYRNTHLELKE